MERLAQFRRRIVLPLEGKGDRSAVDEVNCRLFHCRGALFADARNKTEWEVSRPMGANASSYAALKPSPMRGRGTALAVDEVPTRAPDFVASLSTAFDSDLTANLSPALRAARVEVYCPSKAAVRALNLCGGVNPSNPPLPAPGSAPPALVKASTRPRSGSAATLRSPEMRRVALDIRRLAQLGAS